jgi:hypothetical protein
MLLLPLLTAVAALGAAAAATSTAACCCCCCCVSSNESSVMQQLPSRAAMHASQCTGSTACPHSTAKHGVNNAVVCVRKAAFVAVDNSRPIACMRQKR